MHPSDLNCSIILPTCDRPQQLRRVLESLLALEVSNLSWEVIVVDDGGSLDLTAAIGDLENRLPLRILVREHGGPGKARNYGASEARGQLLLFTDDDCRPGKDWMIAYWEAFQAQNQALLGGRTENALPENRWSSASENIAGIARKYFNQGEDGPRFFPSNNMAVPADLYRQIGGFDTDYEFASEDRDLCDRWQHAGWPLAEVSKACVHHAHWLSARSYFRQHFKYGRGAWRFHRKRQARGTGTFTSDIRFYTKFPGIFRQVVPEGRRASQILPLIVWQVANLFGFISAGFSGSRANSQQLGNQAGG